ncbi:hypothetical protein [Streptomyces eurythermus]
MRDHVRHGQRVRDLLRRRNRFEGTAQYSGEGPVGYRGTLAD